MTSKLRDIIRMIKESGARSDEMINSIKGIRNKLASAAQKVYDEWEQDEEGNDEMYGRGGICDDIADAMTDVLRELNFDTFTLYDEYDYHTRAYAVDHDSKTIIEVDIPPGHYETGAGYTWKKIPDVEFDYRYIHIKDLSEFYDNWFDENGEFLGA